jgi:hypothetical protein
MEKLWWIICAVRQTLVIQVRTVQGIYIGSSSGILEATVMRLQFMTIKDQELQYNSESLQESETAILMLECQESAGYGNIRTCNTTKYISSYRSSEAFRLPVTGV